MNTLQKLLTQTQVFVTTNPGTPPDPAKTYAQKSSDHPQFDSAGIEAQADLATIQGRRRLWFARAWCGYGFHEDGCQAGLAIAEALGSPSAVGTRDHIGI